jgi:cobalamin-dependent methionine synthase-like protein
MRRVIAFAIADVIASEADVLRRLEMPHDALIAASLRALLDDGRDAMLRWAEPRGVFQEVESDAFAEIYRGEGKNAESTPLEAIYPRAEKLALFAGTVGDRLTESIRSIFRAEDPALATILDAFASETANHVAYALAAEWSGGRPRPPSAREGARRHTVLPYSPGYCGWHVTGQRRLFAALQPHDVGITLSASCLMSPLKSVSGVLVAGDAAVHRFRPKFAFCDECATHDCVPRMASVRR